MTKQTNLPALHASKQLLEALGARKEVVGKTMFKLSPGAEGILRLLVKTSGKTIRKFLDDLASIVRTADASGTFAITRQIEDGVRRSYSISQDSKELFMELAQKYDVSRDVLVENAIYFLAEEVAKNFLSPEERIQKAKIIAEAIDRMTAIFDEDEVFQARETLSAMGDKDFEECHEMLMYVEALYQASSAFSEYIKRKEQECRVKN